MGSMTEYLPGWLLALGAFLLIVMPPTLIRLSDWRTRHRTAARAAREAAMWEQIVAEYPEWTAAQKPVLRLVPPIEEG
jgi:hypothetical protein